MKIKDFFEKEYIQFASNDNYQNLASYIDGFRPTARKAFYTYNNFIKNGKIKVAQLASKTAEKTQYLGGENNINGVIINISKNFTGSNNIALFTPHGHFGDRFFPNSASAPRYIFVDKSKLIENIFRKDDEPLLIEQYFEGQKIEPRFYIPILPMILINGSEGIGTGFSQKILPRDPKQLQKILMNYLKTNKLPSKIKPFYNNYKGKFTWDKENNKWINEGIIKLKETKRGFDYLEITELPININLTNYIKKIERLLEQNKIIDYEDKSDDGKYHFIIKVKSGKDLEYWKKELYLVTTIVENFSCTDEDNKIKVFENEIQLLKKYIDIRLDYYQKRKNYLLDKYNKELEFLLDRVKFIKAIIDRQISIEKRNKQDILNQCEKNSIKFAEEHLKLALYNLTNEKIKELKEQVLSLKKKYSELKNKNIKDIWIEELKDIGD